MTWGWQGTAWGQKWRVGNRCINGMGTARGQLMDGMRTVWEQHEVNVGQYGDGMGTTWGWHGDGNRIARRQHGDSVGWRAHLEEGDGGTVAHAEQEEGDEDGDGGPQPVQLPVLGLHTRLVQENLWTGREWSVLACVRGWLEARGTSGASPCDRVGTPARLG